jgi:FkbM family methyltransferase
MGGIEVGLLQQVKEMVPYGFRKGLLDVVRPNRPGIGPILRQMGGNLTTIFDIGANVGDVSLQMLYYFPKATVYSFEPCSETYDQLVRNIARGGYGDRSRTFKHGFFDKEKKAALNITSFHGANSMLDISEEFHRANPHIAKVATEEISLVRLDDFVAQQGLQHIDLVKIDVEGVEQQILEGGAETFTTKVDTVVMEISFVRKSRATGEYTRLFQLMHDYGFAPRAIYDLAQATDGDWRLAQFDCVFGKY